MTPLALPTDPVERFKAILEWTPPVTPPFIIPLTDQDVADLKLVIEVATAAKEAFPRSQAKLDAIISQARELLGK